eukprot:TRINITY_DN768_c0_g1_i5.p1 TRINITY_DN768_c0_g1~~TRINITY_DN768_c0_g1_i5.p1  ORF type:complete len:760 (+),score=131.50 TRINITY_DN768_c0_g1_i5:550-2829(+)
MSEARISRPNSTRSGRDSGIDFQVNLKTDFFKSADDILLLNRGKGARDEPIRLLESILFIDLSQQQLIDISQISLCWNLKICIFHSNFVASLEPLASAPNLQTIDASSNRIKNIPGKSFWNRFAYLEVLYLHDNPIAQLESLGMLTGAPKLKIVTLFDTPLSLNNNYRHVAVNSMWHLEGMDFYLISDEEIIQDLDLYNTPFAAMSESYFLQLYQPTNPNWNYTTAHKHISNLLTVVKRKMSKLSPVLILQRYIRGWLARKRIPLQTRKVLERINRNLDKWFKPLPWKPSNMPNMRDPSYWFMVKALQAPPPTAQPTFLPPLLEQTNIDFAKLATSINRKLHNQSNRRFERKFSHGSQFGNSMSTFTSHSITTEHVARKHTRTYAMFLKLQKLRKNSWRLLNTSAPTFGHLYKTTDHRHHKHIRKLSHGSINTSITSPTDEVLFRDQYHLVSKQEPIISLDLYEEMLFTRRDMGIEIRQAEEDIHKVQRICSKSNVPTIVRKRREDAVSAPPMNIRHLESIMKRATGNENRQKESKERRENVEKIKEQSQLGKMSAEMWRERSRDRLCQLGRNEFEEKKENADRIKLDEEEEKRLRVMSTREEKSQAREKRGSLVEATRNSSHTRDAKLLLSDEVISKISKENKEKRLRVEKAKNYEKQSIQKILQNSIEKTRKIQSIRVAEKDQLIEKMIQADNTRQLDNKQRIRNVKTPSHSEEIWSREGITPSYFLPKAGSISPTCGGNSIQIKCGAQINLTSLQT